MAQFASDAFTNAAGTALPTHNAAWTKHPTPAGTAVITDADRVRHGESGQESVYYHSGAPASADYSVSADLFFKDANGGTGATGVAGRIDTAAKTFYFARYSGGTFDRWELYKYVAGTATLLGSFAEAITDETSHNIKLEMVGTAIKLYRDGSSTATVSVTDSSISAAGKAGLYLRDTSSVVNTAGIHPDNFSADDVAASGVVEADANSAGIATVTGVSGATAGSDGASAGVATTSGAGAGLIESVAASAGVATTSGVGAGVGAATGASDGVATATGVSGADAGVVASSTGTATTSGDSGVIAASVASSAGTSTAQADTSGDVVEATASSAGTSTATGVSGAIQGSVGASSGASTADGIGADGAAVVVAPEQPTGGYYIRLPHDYRRKRRQQGETEKVEPVKTAKRKAKKKPETYPSDINKLSPYVPALFDVLAQRQAAQMEYRRMYNIRARAALLAA